MKEIAGAKQRWSNHVRFEDLRCLKKLGWTLLRFWLAGVAALAIGVSGAHAAGGAPFYRLESATTLAGAAPAWDYLSFDAARGDLFINRRRDGVTVFDVAAGKVLARIEHSEGANATTLVPEFDRGYTTNADGSTTVFALSTLKTVGRMKLGEDADAAVYDPNTKQLAFMMGDSKSITFVDARTAAIVGRLSTDSEKLEAAAPDGLGNVFVAERDLNAVAKIDARRRAQVASWKIDRCEQPTGLAFDAADQRIFVGCRGREPVLAVLDARTGRTVATLPIGRGNDGVIYDAATRRVFTSNGVEGDLVIFDQTGPDSYALAQALTTRPMARTMALDPRSKRLFLVAAEGMVDPAKPVNSEAGPFYPNTYFDDTLTLLIYAPR